MGKSKNIRELFVISLVIFFLLLLGSLDMASAQARLDIPAANLQVSNAVPIGLIKKIALEKSKETWGPGSLGDPIPLCNLDGDVVVYMVPFSIGKGQFPAYDEIRQGIMSGRELQKLIKNSDFEKAKEMHKSMDHGKVLSHQRTIVISDSQIPGRPPINAVRSDGSISRKAELRDIEEFASKKVIGADEFGTIFVSATYDMFPVLAYFHYLAPYYINFDFALERAEQFISQGAFLKSIYFLGLEGQYFEFVNNSSSIVLNSKTLQATTVEDLKRSRISQGYPQTDSTLFQERKEKRAAELTKEWEKIKSEIGEQ